MRHRSSPTRSARTIAGCGISRPTRRWTRTGSARISAAVEEAYQEVARRLGILPEGGPSDLKAPKAMHRIADPAMKARIPRDVEDRRPRRQGKAIAHALGNLGFTVSARSARASTSRSSSPRPTRRAPGDGRADVPEAPREYRSSRTTRSSSERLAWPISLAGRHPRSEACPVRLHASRARRGRRHSPG